MTEQLALKSHLEQTHIWQTLQQQANEIRTQTLEDLFAQYPERADKMSLDIGDMFLDYSKHLLSQEILQALKTMAQNCALEQRIEDMFKGKHVNTTENRPAWHSALRQVLDKNSSELPQRIRQDIEQTHVKMADWVKAFQNGYKGGTGKNIKDIVHIGIGGSDLGPRFLLDALKGYHQSKVNIHFVANIDPEELEDCLSKCKPETTFFILASKSFSTQETLENGALAKAWLAEKINKSDLNKHFLAITANPQKAKEWGIKLSHTLPMWDWVGGRFSIWSSIALPVAIKIGMDNFKAFLEGGHEMDKHFRDAPLLENMPVLMALIGIWYNNFLNIPTTVILPYSHRLKGLPDYLQQLDMESNGKSIQKSNRAVGYNTGPILWGQAGTNGQHAFYQLLHQGTHQIPADFILVAKPTSKHAKQHQLLLAHGLAQTRALMMGQQVSDPHQCMQGNRPSSTLVLKEISPKTIGMLIALFEHKVYVQGVVWNINSFDQPGVQLGKVLANQVYGELTESKGEQLDTSTIRLLSKIKYYQSS